MKYKTFKINSYKIADYATVATIILIIMYIMKIRAEIFIPFSLFFTGTSLLFATFFTKSAVKNKSTTTLYAKDENSSKVLEVEPQQTVTDIDGISANKIVYKIPNGVHAKINNDFSLKIDSFFGGNCYIQIEAVC